MFFVYILLSTYSEDVVQMTFNIIKIFLFYIPMKTGDTSIEDIYVELMVDHFFSLLLLLCRGVNKRYEKKNFSLFVIVFLVLIKEKR